jgi:hypothetical protein
MPGVDAAAVSYWLLDASLYLSLSLQSSPIHMHINSWSQRHTGVLSKIMDSLFKKSETSGNCWVRKSDTLINYPTGCWSVILDLMSRGVGVSAGRDHRAPGWVRKLGKLLCPHPLSASAKFWTLCTVEDIQSLELGLKRFIEGEGGHVYEKCLPKIS